MPTAALSGTRRRGRLSNLLLDIPIDVVDYGDVIERVSVWTDFKQRPAAYITQANAHSLVTAQKDSVYKEVLLKADISVPDGMPLVWLLRLKGNTLKGRIYGPDLMLMMCEEAAKKGWRCFMYGGKPGVAEQLKGVLEKQFPGLKIAGTYSPPFRTMTQEEDEVVCRMINSSKVDILWVALGSPKQDIWMYEHRDKVDVSVMHGVGAAFDFLGGQVKQAPRWMMNAGLEWFFRLMMEPRRLWKRYTINNVLFLYYLLMETIGFRRYG